MNKVGTAYILWLGGLVGLSGLHRLYNGETKTGLLWLGTFGLFGFGQLLDLILIPKWLKFIMLG
ncbi:MAG TPA: NINE protein [Leptolyngbya sp.]|nr:NINE protein [Leptolyngbya sp.]